MATIRDLLRYSPAFRFGAIILVVVLLLIALLVSVHLSACGGGGKIQLKYPGETLVFPHLDDQAPRLYIDLVNDLRPESQRAGHGMCSCAHCRNSAHR